MVHQLSKTMMLSLSMLLFASTAHQASSVPDVAPKCSSNSADQSDAADLLDESLCLLQAESKLLRQKIMDSKEEPTKADLDTLSFLQEAAQSAGGSLRAQSLLGQMKAMAEADARGDLDASPITQQMLAGIVDLMEKGVINVTLVNHGEDQREANRAHQVIVDCTTTMQGEFTMATTGINALKSTMESNSGTHSACRGVEASLNGTKISKCTDFESFANGLKTPSCLCPSLPAGPSPALLACIQEAKRWATSNNATYVDKRDQCDVAKTNLNDKKTTCDSDQGTFESSFCSYGQKLTTTCSTYSTCRSTSIGTFNSVVSDIKVSEAARKAEYKAAKKVICYIGVLKAAPTDKPSALDTCNKATYGTTLLDIAYPTAPSAATCDVTPVDDKPCTSGFLSTYYIGKPWSSGAPAIPCSACSWA